MTQDVKHKIDALIRKIEHHNHLYHVLDDPDISDGDYDRTFQRASVTGNGLSRLPAKATHRHSGSAANLYHNFNL